MDELHKERVERYLRTNLEKGYSEDSLKWALIKQGHSRTEVTKALSKVKKELSEKDSKGKEKPVIKYELYDQDNKPVSAREPFSIIKFFKDLFS